MDTDEEFCHIMFKQLARRQLFDISQLLLGKEGGESVLSCYRITQAQHQEVMEGMARICTVLDHLQLEPIPGARQRYEAAQQIKTKAKAATRDGRYLIFRCNYISMRAGWKGNAKLRAEVKALYKPDAGGEAQ